jgi:hypothetical protein
MIKRLIFKMMNEKIQGLFRHILTFGAGILVTKGRLSRCCNDSNRFCLELPI